MKMYRAFVQDAQNQIHIVEQFADSAKGFRANFHPADGETILNVIEANISKPRKRVQCLVTYAYLVRGESGKYEIKRETVTVTGTAGGGKRAEQTIRWFAKQSGHELPDGAKIETVETVKE